MKRLLLGAMLFCILVPCTLAFGQTATTSLRGVITDPSGALVPGATITITDQSVDKTLTATANASGLYQFLQIPPAKYLITVTANGFGSQSKTAELLVNQPATVDFKLTLQSSSVTVDVSASAQTLNTTDASIGNAVDNQTIQAMPLEGRDPISLLAMQPGVLFLGEGGGGSANGNGESSDSRQGAVSGSRSDQGNVTLDGLDDNDQLNGYAFTGVLRSTLDSTEEFRVTTSNGTADAGRSSGAQVALVTKKGTNKFHGALYEYYRPTNTVANDFFLKNSQIASGDANKPVHYVKNVFGGSIGGPIVKDKLFFFFNYEGLRQAINGVVQTTVPTASFLAGNLGYQDEQGNNQMINSAQIAKLDAKCVNDTFNGSPICPWGPGVNPNVISYYSNVPTATGSASGDGLNSGSYFFSGSRPLTQNTSIGKIDYNLSSKQQLFFRGNLQKDTTQGSPQFPGQPASTTTEDNTKGLAAGYTWTPTSSIVNDVRYGYIRQGYGQAGVGQGDYVFFRFLTQPEAQTRTSVVSVPVHNISDTLNWTKGNHSLSFGGNWRLVQNNRSTDANSFSGASTNPYWLGGNPPDPSTLGDDLPPVGSSFGNSWIIAYASMLGTVPSATATYNYAVSSPTAATLLEEGAFIPRHFKANEFEYFLQDTWRIKPNLTITAGLRHTLLQTPYETKGQEIAPTVNTHNWFKERGYAASKGEIFEQDLLFSPAGKANGRPGYWPRNKMDLAPRISVVYSPNAKTSFRAGAGIYYDHYGEALVNTFDQEGSFGLSTSLTNPAGQYSYTTTSTRNAAPRFTDPHALPAIPLPGADSTATFPYLYPKNNFAIQWGVDSRIKTPYSESFNLSFQRELPGGFLFEEAYVGRLGRHLLQQLDLAEPVNFVDPQGAGDYYTAGTQLSKAVDQHGGAYCNANDCPNGPAPVHIPTIQYVEDVFPQMKNLDFDGETATDGLYNNEWAPYRYTYGATTSLSDVDAPSDAGYCYYGGSCASDVSKFWQDQFASLYAWSSIGNSSYHALQVTLRHPATHGLTMDFSYTLSKSLDMNSGSERANEYSSDNLGGSAIQNTWNPKLNKAVSDFDTRHLVNADMVYVLPVGRGKRFLGNAPRPVDAVLGGWSYSGLTRWTSGLPFSLFEPGWTTNWQLEGYGVKTAYVKTRRHLVDGLPQVFDDPSAINKGIKSANGPVRLPYPGEAGMRNAFRGQGYFDLDSRLAKSWGLGEYGKLNFVAEVFDLTNTQHSDVVSITSGLTSGTLGTYGASLGSQQYRRMEFGLRYDF